MSLKQSAILNKDAISELDTNEFEHISQNILQSVCPCVFTSPRNNNFDGNMLYIAYVGYNTRRKLLSLLLGCVHLTIPI